MSWITEYFAEAARRDAEVLEKAEREAAARGQEPFDLAKLEHLLNRGSQAKRAKAHRLFYLLHEEFSTLAEYVAHLHAIEPWEDCR